MPRGIAKPKNYERYGVDILDPITKEILRTEYFKNVDEIAEKLNLSFYSIKNIILKRNCKRLGIVYNIYHIDKNRNKIEGLWTWKTDHKKNTSADSC